MFDLRRFPYRRFLTVAICFLIALALGLRIGVGGLFAAAFIGWAFADGAAGSRNPYLGPIVLGVCVFAVVVFTIVFAARRRFLIEVLAVPAGLYIGASLSFSSGLSRLAQAEIARTHNGSIQQYVHPVLQPARATVTTGHLSYVAFRATSFVVATPKPIFLGMARVVPAPPLLAVRVHSDGSLGAHGLEKDEDTALESIVPESGGAGWLFFGQNRFDSSVTGGIADKRGGIVFIVGPDCAGNEDCNKSFCRRDASNCYTTFGRIAGDGSRTFMQPPGEGDGLIDLARIVPGRSGDLWFYDRLHDSIIRVASNGRTYLVYRVPGSHDGIWRIRTSISAERDAIWINDVKNRSLLMFPTDGGAPRALVYPRGRHNPWLLLQLLAGDASGIWLGSTDGIWWYGIDGAVEHFDSPALLNLDRFVTMTLDHRLLVRVERPGSLQYVEVSPSGDTVYHNVPPEEKTALPEGIAKFENGDLFYGRLASQADQLERIDREGRQWIVDVAPQRLNGAANSD